MSGEESARVAALLRDMGRRIAELRQERGLTQEQFAEELRLARSHVQRIEQGGLNLTVRSLAKLADHFGVGVADLFAAPRSAQARRGRPPKRRTEAK